MQKFTSFLRKGILQAFQRLLPKKPQLPCPSPRVLAPIPRISAGHLLDDRMDIRRQQFGSYIVNFLQAVADSHFVAFDLEFSGIPERNPNRAEKPSLQENYLELRQAVQKYQILQIGLTLITFDAAKAQYVAQPYNFTISPLPDLRERQFRRDWSMNSGAISFLHRHGFDFGTWITHGIHYLSREEENSVRAKLTAEAVRQDMIWKSEDEPLVQHIRQSIVKWQAQPKSEQEEFLNIPDGTAPGIPTELNRYQMRLTHQIVQNEYPGLLTRGMAHFIQITNPDEVQQANQKRIEAQQREQNLSKAVGFRWIMEGIAGKDISRLPNDFVTAALDSEIPASEGEVAVQTLLRDLGQKLRDRRKIFIGHNCLTDLMYLYKMTIGELPNHVNEFCDKLHDLFPAIVDTKYLASCYSDKYGRNMLGDVEYDLRSTDIPSITAPPEFDRYLESTYYHEAGFDSFLTATVAIKLSAKLFKEGPKKKADQKQEEEKVASSTTEFGVEEGYITAAESVDSAASLQAETSATGRLQGAAVMTNPLPPNDVGSPNAADSNTVSSTPKPASVVAVKEKVPEGQSSSSGIPTTQTDKSAIDSLHSAFASTSIYDKLGSDGEDTKMPGDEELNDSNDQHTLKRQQAMDLNHLVKSGEMMPRWHEEKSFWEVYGNRLQVNGTKEGVLKLVD